MGVFVALQNQAPLIVTLIKEPTSEVNIGDVLLGSLGLAGVLVLLAAVLGVVVAAGMVVWKKLHPPESDHLPPITQILNS